MKYLLVALSVFVVGCSSAESGCPCSKKEQPRSVAATTAPVKSQTSASPAPKRSVEYARRETVTIEADEADLREVIDQICRQAGVNIVVEPNINEKVTLTLREVPWMEAVQLIAERTKCEVNLLRDGVYYVINPPRVTLRTY